MPDSAEGGITPSAFFAKKEKKRMEKQKITVTVAGKPYTLVSSDPPEHVRRVAAYVDRTLSETASATKLPSAQAAVLSCFRMAEELLKAQDENRMLQRRIEELGARI
jgi:cell division protein ZapA